MMYVPSLTRRRCRFSHDIDAYLAAKPQDLRIPSVSEFTETPPFGPDLSSVLKPHSRHPNVDTATQCHIFAETGECRYGYKCRFLGGHVQDSSEGNLTLLQDESKKAHAVLTGHEMNFIGAENQKRLRAKRYPLPIATQYLRDIEPKPTNSAPPVVFDASRLDEPGYIPEVPEEGAKMEVDETLEKRTGEQNLEAAKDTQDVPVRFSEKKRLNWKGKTYLAPLTTVGNLVS